MTTCGELMTPSPIVDDRGAIVGIVAQADLATRLGRPEETAQVIEAISEGQNGTSRTVL